MLVEISAGLGSLKAAKDILKGLDATRTGAAINEVKIELQSLILEAQDSLSAARDAQSETAERIRQLEREIADLKGWETEKQRYRLQDVHRGSVAYVPKPGMEDGQPAHWLCANCFSAGRKSFLQFKGQDKRPNGVNGDESTYACDACKASMKVNYKTTPERLKAQGGHTNEPEPDGPTERAARMARQRGTRVVTSRPY